MSCAAPLSLAALVDYWVGEGEAAARDAAEMHIFGCGLCAARLERLVALGDRAVARLLAGQVRVALTRPMVERLAADGAVLRHYAARPGEVVACSVGARDDYVVSWLDADFASQGQVDLEVTWDDGAPLRFDDVLVDREAGAFILALPGDAARALPRTTIRFRLHEQAADGARLVGEYVFRHSPELAP